MFVWLDLCLSDQCKHLLLTCPKRSVIRSSVAFSVASDTDAIRRRSHWLVFWFCFWWLLSISIYRLICVLFFQSLHALASCYTILITTPYTTRNLSYQFIAEIIPADPAAAQEYYKKTISKTGRVGWQGCRNLPDTATYTWSFCLALFNAWLERRTVHGAMMLSSDDDEAWGARWLVMCSHN